VSERQWPVKPLEDVVEILDKFRVPVNSKERESRKGNIPYYGATGQTGWIDDYIFDEELVLLGEDGAPFLDHSKPSAYIIRGKAWVNNHAHVLRGKPGLNNRFLLHYLNQLNYTPYISGTTRAKLPQGPMKQIPIPIPPINYQLSLVEAIDTQLSRLDETVATLEAIQAKLKQARASILKAAVEGRLVETEANISAPRSCDHPSRQDQQEVIAIPDSWSIHQAKTVCNSIESGSTPSKEHFRDSPDKGVPFIKVYHLTFTGKLAFLENKPTYVSKEYHVSKMKRSLTLPGDVLTNIVGPPLGKVSIVPSKSHEWNINQAIARFRCGPTLLPAFLAIYLQSHHAQSWLATTSKTTTSQVNLSISNCRLLPIPVPPFFEQEQIVAEVDRRFSVLDQVEATVNASLARCALLRQAILKRAFEGRLVPAPG
jgi:type I restriction enzyme S subunit